MKKSSYLSERVYDAIPSEINMESLEYWKKILKEEGLQYCLLYTSPSPRDRG